MYIAPLNFAKFYETGLVQQVLNSLPGELGGIPPPGCEHRIGRFLRSFLHLEQPAAFHAPG
jgi:hypothetical protein